MNWKDESLSKLFNPETIAVVGASDKPQKLGGLALRALSTSKCNLIPVNPRISSLGGLKCYPSVEAAGQEVDLAVIALQAPLILPAIQDCAAAGVKSAIVFSAGFRELGEAGEELQAQMKAVADAAHIAIIGPNCLGAGNSNIGLNATFFPHPVELKKGKVSLVSQSGGVAGLMIYAASDAGLGIAKFASIGNRVNVDFDDMLRFLAQDSETEVVCLFVEGTERGRSMYEEMAKLTPRKPVVVYKVGKTPAAMRAARSHTGSLAGQQRLYSAAVHQAKGIEVDTVSDMIDAAKVLVASSGRRRGPNAVILTHTLGPALIVAQILEERGIRLPMPLPDTATTIEEMLSMPVHVPISNPVDLLAQGWSEPRIFAGALELLLKDDRYDALMTVFSPNYQEDIGGGMPVEHIVRCANESDKIVIAVLNAPESRPPPGRSVLEEGGIPVFFSPERAARALASVLATKD
ncbi:MAG: hypothetical protein C4K47_05370 [Candidatus Thorarchaeota archaeon]|nr:MAG: hypothetical protein C4K47_05370 [Candidatus Thorarchaeota archaeon]